MDRLIGGVLAGTGQALMLSGDAGVGKSALLRVLQERATRDGATVLAVNGVASEAQLAFSALADLLTPLLGSSDDLPRVQRAALLGALALGPCEPGDRFAVCAGTLGLLVAAAAARPVMVVVDDAQWVDASSWECVRYAARRAAAHRLGMAFASREPAALPGAGDLPQLHVDPLDAWDSRDLLSRVAPDLERTVRDRVLEAAGGLPLALVELAEGLTPEQRCGLRPVKAPLRPGPLLNGMYLRRIRALPARSRTCLVVAAAHEGDDLRAVADAARGLGCDAADLTAAEEAGLIRIANGRLHFAHPLVRGAAYHGVSGMERRAAHGALAAVLIGDRRTWHRAAAVVGPDEEVAAELERVALAPRLRRAPVPASRTLERSARLTPDRATSNRRLFAAGELAVKGGQPERALSLFDEVIAQTDDDALCASVRHAQGLTMLWCRGVAPAVEVLTAEAARIQHDRPGTSAVMLADASLAFTTAADTHGALEVAERAVALLGDHTTATDRAHVFAALGWALMLRGQADRARRVLVRVDELMGAGDPLGPTGDQLKGWLYSGIVSGAFEGTYTHTAALCANAREEGALGVLPDLLVVLGDCAYRMGDWMQAEQALTEAHRICRDTGQDPRGHAAVTAARLAAARGQADECRAIVDAVMDQATALGMRSGLHYARAARGFLELGLGRPSAAVDHLEWVSRAVEHDGMAEPTLIPWAPDLVEAYLRVGRTRAARREAKMLCDRAGVAGTVTAAAASARCRGLVEDDYDGHFLEALRLDDARPVPFERARTQLAYGRRLHRANRRVEARKHLHEAAAAFQRLGARPWEAQAMAELRVAGGRRGRRPSGRLTDQERRIVAAVQRGGSNRDIAAELFLSPKTVEFHLGRIYRKLDIRSRTQLAVTRDRAAQIDEFEERTASMRRQREG